MDSFQAGPNQRKSVVATVHVFYVGPGALEEIHISVTSYFPISVEEVSR